MDHSTQRPDSRMNRAQALRVLGLHEDVTQVAIHESVVARGNQAADDREGYDQVIEAGRVLGVIGPGEPQHLTTTALAIRQTGELAEQRRQSLELARLGQEERNLRREEADREVKQITEVRVDPLRRARRRYAWLGAVSGLIGAVGLLLRGVGGLYGISNSGDTVFVTGAAICIGVGALVGLLAATMSLQVQSLESAFQDVTATLSRRATLAAVLRGILDEKSDLRDESETIAEEDLERAAHEWMFNQPSLSVPLHLRALRSSPVGLHELARRMRPGAFAQILVAKGKECELLTEHEDLDEHGNLVVGYQIRVVPRAASGVHDGRLAGKDESPPS